MMEKKIRRYVIKIPNSSKKDSRVLVFDSYKEAALKATKNNTIIGGRIYFIYNYE